MTEKTRILIAEDHAVMRKNIAALIATQSDMVVVAMAVNGEEAVQLTEQFQPDVIVLDIYMPFMDGLEAIKKIRETQSQVLIVIMSLYANRQLVENALRLGAQGYVLKPQATQDLLPAIRSVRQNKTFLSPALFTLFSDA
ncbi:MAG: response regulator transcription factor [Caldilinea sp.]|jgi:DNA-binding NarL/FixJ family response regulator|nr:response regulator transcription factor [Caldilinea sp.]